MGVSYMQKLVPENHVDQIFRLRLPARLIADRKVAFPILIQEKMGASTYKVLIPEGDQDISSYDMLALELKGNIDIECLKFGAKASVTRIIEEPDCYKMEVDQLYRINDRKYRRVPYSRIIKIISPIECDGQLINISASGALFYSVSEVKGTSLTISFTLMKRDLVLNADIIEQTYIMEEKMYQIRCHFNPIDSSTRKHIIAAVREITLRAKARLQS